MDFQRLPKVDLHRHLEGAIRPKTVLELAVEQGVSLPAYELDDLRRYLQVRDDPPDFHNFLGKFQLIRELWRSLDAIERAAAEAVEDAGKDNVKYLELRFSPRHFARKNHFAIEDVCDRVINGARRAAARDGMTVNFIVTLGRDFGIDANRESAEYAVAGAGRHIVGLDIAGDEVNHSAIPFLPFFERAKDAGLGITIHAGEAGGPENVREAIEVFHADRIGHGIAAARDPSVMDLALERGVAFEVCLTSNLHTGVVADIERHPIRELLSRGLAVTLNTDDPAISNDITLTHEYNVARDGVGLDKETIRSLILNGVAHAFFDNESKERMMILFRKESSSSPTGDVF